MFNKEYYKYSAVLFIILFCFLVALGNFVNISIFSKRKVNLGLDLRGGSHLLLQVDFNYYLKEQLNNDIDLIKNSFLENRIKALPKLYNDEIEVLYKNENDLKDIKKEIKKINNNFIFTDVDNKKIILRYKDNYISELKKKVNKETVEIIRKRIDEFGTKDSLIQVEGNDKILIQVAGLSDSSALKELLGKTAKLTFHLVSDSDNNYNDLITLKDSSEKYELTIEKKALLSGDSLIDAGVTYDKGKPVITFKLNNNGAKKFSDITKNNFGKILAIVLDDKIITAPRINGRIDGGSGIITGDFSIEEATKTALLLKSGSLIAPLSIIEEKTVGATLGQDLIEQGIKVCCYGLILIVLFIAIFYKKFGILSNIIVFINMIVLCALLSFFNITLTLPGIAGIILTIGMSTDATILIFERIKEEYLKNSDLSSLEIIKNGFNNTMSTILDSNITTIIVAVILYIFGTGAIKGFAIILILGIISSIFSSVICLRYILNFYYKNRVLLIK